MGEDENVSLAKYMIVIHGPPESPSGRIHQYNTNQSGEGSISLYEVLGRAPSLMGDLAHVVSGGFGLQYKPGKTLEEFMQEVREGIRKIISSEK